MPSNLDRYREKRSPGRTPEPFDSAPSASGRLYVMQKHAARNLHYDLRLELDGVLKSWAVPKDPSYDQAVKRAAFMVEDHPVEYATFEGVIPKGNYGAGEVIVWDRGVWVPLEDPHAGLEKGKLLFELRGHRMRGRWTLVRTKRGDNDWLLIKERDALEGPDRDTFRHDSILTGRTLEDLRSGTRREDVLRAAIVTLEPQPPQRALAAADVEPMLAETRREPFDDDAWVFELKYDGYRVIAGRDESIVLLSRNGNDMARAFPEIVEAIGHLPFERFVLDGEIVVHDDAGLPSFQRLQKRARLRREPDVRRAVADLPASLYVFDLPGLLDRDLRPLPLLARKQLLRELLPSTGVLRYSDHIAGQGVAFHQLAESMQLEGVIAKRAASPYRSGRSGDWLKIRAQRTDDFVVVGLKASKNARGAYGSLHIAQYGDGALAWAGSVGTGITTKHINEALRRAGPTTLPTSAATGAPRSADDVWLEPRAVVEVRFLERTEAGQLRHPVFLRFRDDKPPAQCIAPADASAESAEDRAPTPAASTSSEPAGSQALAGSGEDAPQEPAPQNAASRPGSARRAGGSPPSGNEERAVRLTNQDKVLWPEDGYTKGDLVAYYRSVARWILPYLRDRPVVQTRFPDGIHGKSFFQKDAPEWAPAWLRTETIWSGGSERELRYFVADDEPSLDYLANNASIPLHIWSSRVGSIERPDWCSLDLDPKGAPFEHVIAVARAVHRLCERIRLPCYVKTSGSSGLHVLIPLGRQFTHEHARVLGELLARRVVAELPDIATVARAVSRRQGRVYVDYLQNGHGKLLVSPWCVRPIPGAPVSTPLRWTEVKAGLDIRAFTIRTVPTRLARSKRDPLHAVLTDVPDLMSALTALQAI